MFAETIVMFIFSNQNMSSKLSANILFLRKPYSFLRETFICLPQSHVKDNHVYV